MSLIRLNDVSVTFEKTPVLREVFLKLENGDRVGMIGRNGSGKSTILKLILEQVSPDAGTVVVEPGVKLGYFSQFSELNGAQTITEVLDELFTEIKVIEAELASIDATIAMNPSPSVLDDLIHRQSELFGEMERLDGWDYTRRIDTALTRLGFAAEHRVCAIDELSGGWRNRAALAKILLENPDVLLLDEPTNYLDVSGVEWLEGWFRDFRGAALALGGIVTHVEIKHGHHVSTPWDQAFPLKTSTCILNPYLLPQRLGYGGLLIFNGINYLLSNTGHMGLTFHASAVSSLL